MLLVSLILCVTVQAQFEKDTLTTAEGDLVITFIGHGTLMFEYNDLVIHVDPWTRIADYDRLPSADLVLVTHHHADHADKAALDKVLSDQSVLIWTEICSRKGDRDGIVLENGETTEELGLTIEAVPAYNLEKQYHPKGDGNGYVVTFADLRVYIAGDTENIPEMAELEDIEVAFIPMNVPYTMTPAMAADAARMVDPKILYPYHFGDTDTQKLVSLLENGFEGEVRIRKMK